MFTGFGTITRFRGICEETQTAWNRTHAVLLRGKQRLFLINSEGCMLTPEIRLVSI